VFEHLKPSDDEIRKLALRETDPTQVHRFEPIARGPVFAVIALATVLLLALPSCALRLLRGLARRGGERA
jgi:hypothetical protein